MPSVALALLTVALGLVVLYAPLRIGFAIVVVSLLAVPASLPLPNPVTHSITCTRLLVLALFGRLLLWWWGRRRAAAGGDAQPDVWRWTVVHTAFVVFLAGMYLGGVV